MSIILVHVAACQFSCAMFQLGGKMTGGNIFSWYGAYIDTYVPCVYNIFASLLACHGLRDNESRVPTISANFRYCSHFVPCLNFHTSICPGPSTKEGSILVVHVQRSIAM